MGIILLIVLFFFKFILSKVNIKYLFSQNCRFKPRATALPTMPQRPLKNTKLTTVTYLQIVKFKMSALISFYIKIRNNEYSNIQAKYLPSMINGTIGILPQRFITTFTSYHNGSNSVLVPSFVHAQRN